MKFTAKEARALVTESDQYLAAVLDVIEKKIIEAAKEGKSSVFVDKHTHQALTLDARSWHPSGGKTALQNKVSSELTLLGYHVGIEQYMVKVGVKCSDSDEEPHQEKAYRFRISW